MSIDAVNRTAATTPAGRGAARVPGRGFQLPHEAAGSLAAPGAASEVTLGGMLALQEAESGAVQDREARRRGQDLLAELAALQRALLDEADPEAAPAALQRLASLARAVPQAASPALRQALAAIVLRSRVELARYDHDNSENTSRPTR